jgi:20S proteasome subunit alpha 7
MLGTEKLVVSEMMVSGSDRRVYAITKQIAMVFTGIIPDGRCLVERAREESASFQKNFGIPITGKVLAERIAGFVHMNTIHMWARPYGCTVVIASFDELNGPQLHLIDSSGQCYGYFGCSSGKGRQTVRNEIEKLNPKNMSCKEAAYYVTKL